MKKKLLKFLAVACSLTCIATAGLGTTLSGETEFNVAKAYEITLADASALKSDYPYGDLLSIPMGTIDGEPTTKYIVFSPTGKVYDTASVSLLEEGQYTIVWYANVGGKEVSAKKSFFVTKSAFTLDGGGAYPAYVESLDRSKEEDGITFSLEAESTLRYNRAIDLADTSVPFAKIFPYQRITNLEEATRVAYEKNAPLRAYNDDAKQLKKELKASGMTDEATIEREVKKQLGNAPTEYSAEYQYNEDARNYLITLTDRCDPTNYVTIDLEWLENRTYWNFRASAVGQKEHGIRNKKDGVEEQVTIDGKEYNYYYAPSQGRTSCNITDDKGLELYYDVEKNHVYMTFWRYTYDDDGDHYTENKKLLIADLSNEVIYPTNPFKGFTTSEVYVAISAKNYAGNTASIDIASLGGISGRDLLEADMHDTKAPVIAVDEDLRGGSPFIAVGEEIEIPDAIAHDVNLPYGTKATTSVYYAYTPNNDKNVSVGLVNGKFTPQKAGVYTIVYTATDPSGNVGTATVALQCKNGVDNKAVKLAVDEEIEGKAGELLPIPECTVLGLYSDENLLKRYVQFEDGEKTLLTGDDLFLKGVGRYVLTYEYETPFKTYTTTCVVTTSASENITLDAPILPEYFIKGAKYTLDPVYAYEYTTKEPVAVETKVFMRADGGSYEEVNRKEVTINASSTVSFKYEHKGEVAYSETISVLDVGFNGKLAAEKYFHSEENAFIGEATNSGVRYVADGTTPNATMKYINTLSLSSFGFEFQFLNKIEEKEFIAPTNLTLTLVDYYDRENKVTLGFTQFGGSTEFSVNGERKTMLSNALLGTKFSVEYSNGFSIDGKTYAWNGAFTSDRMLLWVTLNDMVDDTCLEITSLGIGTLKKVTTTDKVKPVLTYSELNTGSHSMNKVITIAQAYAYDLIAPYVESGLSLTVTMPDGSFATSEDGVKLDGTCPVNRSYALKLTMAGTYLVTYTYVEQNGNTLVGVDRPNVQDQTSPVITVEGATENEIRTATWGANVKVASYTVTDETSAKDELKAWVCVFSPSGIVRQVDGNGTFYAEEKGKYTVFYHCYDKVGNYTTFKYFVVVS